MALFDSKQKSIILELRDDTKNNHSLNKEAILCKHCKRTASNGIRCMGMCVADNDY